MSEEEAFLVAKEKVKYLENKNENLEMENVILKKYMPSLEQEIVKSNDIYSAIYNALKDGKELNINKICKLNKISQSWYYKYLKSLQNKEYRKIKDGKLIAIIFNIFYKYKSKMRL